MIPCPPYGGIRSTQSMQILVIVLLPCSLLREFVYSSLCKMKHCVPNTESVYCKSREFIDTRVRITKILYNITLSSNTTKKRRL